VLTVRDGYDFIVNYCGLLVAAVTFLYLNKGSFAKKLAGYAYHNLVVGVLLQCVVIIVEGKRVLADSNLLLGSWCTYACGR